MGSRRRRPCWLRARRTLGACALTALALAGALGCATRTPAAARTTAASPEDRAVDATLAYTPYVTVGGSRRRDVALTFDDGPGEWTPRIVAALRREHAPATFFQIGEQVPDLAGTTRSLSRLGFPVGDHTQTHPLLAHHKQDFQSDQLNRAAAAIQQAGAPYPRLFRPPYGSFNQVTLQLLAKLRMLMVLWTNDTEDYAHPGVRHIVDAALADLRPGAIVLMHDGGGDRSQTVAALPIVIHSLRARGYRLVTIPQMLIDDPPARHQPIPDGTGPSATS